MDERVKRMVDGLEKAMVAEIEGHHFYQMAANSTKDDKGRQTFLDLAAEEMDHYSFLKTQAEALAKTGKVDSTAKLGEQKALSGSHPIFSEQIKQRVGQAHYEMTALTIGIQLEQSAVEFYRAEGEAASDPDVKALHKDLMFWEQGHLAALQAQADALKEDYWNEARFAPF